MPLVGLHVLLAASACSSLRTERDAGDGGPRPDADADADADGDEGGPRPDADATRPDGDGEGPEADVDLGPDDGCLPRDAPCTEVTCHAPLYDVSCVAARVVDETASPVVGVGVVLSTSLGCVSGDTDRTGFAALDTLDRGSEVGFVAVHVPTESWLTPICRLRHPCDGGLRLCPDIVLHRAPADRLPVPEGPLPAALRVEAEDGAAVVFPEGALVVPSISEDRIALTRYPIEEDLPCFVDPGRPPTALYAFKPDDVWSAEPPLTWPPAPRPAALDLPNATGLAPGATVDVYVLEGVRGPEPERLGEWRAATSAHVTEDGSRIRTGEDEGLGYMSWIGIYPR